MSYEKARDQALLLEFLGLHELYMATKRLQDEARGNDLDDFADMIANQLLQIRSKVHELSDEILARMKHEDQKST